MYCVSVTTLVTPPSGGFSPICLTRNRGAKGLTSFPQILLGFALRNVQTHISKQICIEMCVCTLLNANPVVERVEAHAQK